MSSNSGLDNEANLANIPVDHDQQSVATDFEVINENLDGQFEANVQQSTPKSSISDQSHLSAASSTEQINDITSDEQYHQNLDGLGPIIAQQSHENLLERIVQLQKQNSELSEEKLNKEMDHRVVVGLKEKEVASLKIVNADLRGKLQCNEKRLRLERADFEQRMTVATVAIVSLLVVVFVLVWTIKLHRPAEANQPIAQYLVEVEEFYNNKLDEAMEQVNRCQSRFKEMESHRTCKDEKLISENENIVNKSMSNMTTLARLEHKTDFRIEMKIENFSVWIKKSFWPLKRYSDPVVIHGHSSWWNILVQNKDGKLGFSLSFNGGAESNNNNKDRGCHASVTLRLKSCNATIADIEKKYDHIFRLKKGETETNVGWSSFVTNTQDLLSEDWSCKTDTVTFVAEVTAGFPTGIEVPPIFSFTSAPESSDTSDTLVVANTALTVNKFMLAFQSGYFHNLFFKKEFKECKHQHFEITDPDVNLEDFKLMIELADPFKNKLVPQHKIDAILALSNQYDLFYVKEKCQIALEAKECKKTLFGKVRLAHQYHMETYKKALIGVLKADYAVLTKNHRDEVKALPDDLRLELFDHTVLQD